MKKVNLLSRAEMKKVMGGVEPAGHTELKCTTPDGTEYWRWKCAASDPTADCKAIYPAFSSGVSGECVIVIIE